MNKQFEGYLSIDNAKVVVEDNRIYIPATVEHVDLSLYHGDAISFGYNYDEGLCSVVHYEEAVGALVDDTLNLLSQSREKPLTPSVGIGAIKPFAFSEQELNSWKKNLDSSWAEKIYTEWKNKGWIDEDETKEEWIANKLDSYYSWPSDWLDAYEQDKKERNQPFGALETVVKYNELTLSKDQNGEFFFSSKYYDNGYLTKADKKSALEYIDLYNVFCEQNKAYQKILTQINENILLLKST